MPLFDDVDGLKDASPAIQWAIFIVACLILIVAIFSICVSIWLAIKYVKFNRRMNSKGICGADAAREILDKNGLQNIRVSVVGSLLFGNSYSHYFKKVRIRRLTNKKASITSLAIGAQKASLAILDKEGDPDMRRRVVLTPIIFFGPLAFIPLVVIGIAIDLIVFHVIGVCSLIFIGLGFLFYILSFVLSIMVLKTEVKGQRRACEIMKAEDMATDEEIEMMKELYRIYNIQYINDLIMEFLQLIMRILQFTAKIQSNSSSNNG
jgi:hypothetical protein